MNSNQSWSVSKNGSNFRRAALKDVAPACQVERDLNSREVWHLTLEDVESQTGRVLTHERCAVSELKPSKVWFDTRNVLYSKLRPYLNKVVVPDSPGVATSELIPLRSNSSQLDREFLAHYLRSPEFVDFANRVTQGANLPRVSMTEFWKHDVPVPPLEAQRRIVARIQECLSRVEEMERLQAEVVGDSGKISHSFRTELWHRLKGRARWTSLAEIISSARNGIYKPAKFHGSGTILIRMFNLRDGLIDLSRLERVRTTNPERENFRVSNDDILVSRVNSKEHVGKSALVEGLQEPAVNEAMVIRLSLIPEVAHPRFVSWVMNSGPFLDELRKRAKHAIGQSSINQKDLLTMTIPLPSFKEQSEIVKSYASAVPSSAEMRAEIVNMGLHLPALRNAILRQAFSGEL